MGIYGTLLRTAVAVLIVPGVFFVYLAVADSAPFGVGPLLWAGMVAGLATGLAGSAVETYVGYQRSAGARWMYWLLLTAVITYSTRYFVPVWPLTFWGALILGAVLGLTETIITPQFTAR